MTGLLVFAEGYTAPLPMTPQRLLIAQLILSFSRDRRAARRRTHGAGQTKSPADFRHRSNEVVKMNVLGSTMRNVCGWPLG
jgi:hypothetical protein